MAALLSAATVEAASRLAGLSAAPGILLDLHIAKPVGGKLVELNSLPDAQKTIVMVHVEAVAPPTMKGDFVHLYTGEYRGRPIYLPLGGRLGTVARGWVDAYRQRGSSPDSLETGLLVFVAVLDREALRRGDLKHATIYRTVDVVTYKPADITRGKTVEYTVNIVLDPRRHGFNYTARELRGLLQTLAARLGSDQPHAAKTKTLFEAYPRSPEAGDIFCGETSDPVASYCWRREIYIAPEDLQKVLPLSYFRSVNGKLYTKTPLLIVHNAFDYSDIVLASIDLAHESESIAVYATFSVGPGIVSLVDKEKSSFSPSVTIWKSSGSIWGGGTFYYHKAIEVPPNGWGWAWVWGRPVFAVYREYECMLDCKPTNNTVAISAVTDVLTYGNIIQGGRDYSRPPQILLDAMFAGNELRYVATLAPGDSLPFSTIFNVYDTCGADFEIGIPVGAIVAALIGQPWAKLISDFGVSISVEGSKITIMGGVDNDGKRGITEHVFVATSGLKYRHEACWLIYCKTCYYNVPIGIYIEAR